MKRALMPIGYIRRTKPKYPWSAMLNSSLILQCHSLFTSSQMLRSLRDYFIFHFDHLESLESAPENTCSILHKRVCLCATKYHRIVLERYSHVLHPFLLILHECSTQASSDLHYVFSTCLLPILAHVDSVFNSQLCILADRHILGTLNRL
jgi:hypothetical protein